jgi:hypothetical protein
MAEINILAYFKSREEAERAESQLKLMGVVDLRIDLVSLYPGDGIDVITDPSTGEIPSLAHLTLGAEIETRDHGILISTDVAASGMSGELDEMTGRNFLLIAVVDQSIHEEALKVIEVNGGVI